MKWQSLARGRQSLPVFGHLPAINDLTLNQRQQYVVAQLGANVSPLRTGTWQETSVVTKKEIVKTISDKIGLTQLKTKEIVQQTFDAIVETLVEEKRIELRNFGVFEVKKRAARKARNPRTGERVDVAEKYVVTFKPGKEMEEKVRMLELGEAAQKQLSASSSGAPTQVP